MKFILYAMACTLAFAMMGLDQASAACWRLPGGQIIETNANSTPPVRGARRVDCAARSPPATSAQVEPRGITVLAQTTDPRQCVDYARSRVGALPTGLFSMQDKRNVINEPRPGRARAGYIAIINASADGHVAYVEEVTRNSITISETNYPAGTFRRRRAVGRDIDDAAVQLRIVGYFRP